MLSAVAAEWAAPVVDYHALAPEIILAGGIVVLLLVDLFVADAKKWILGPLASFTMLGAFIPVLTLALSDDGVRSMFDGRYVVDDFSLIIKGLFLLAGYVVILLTADHLREGDYYQGEYWFLLMSSLLYQEQAETGHAGPPTHSPYYVVCSQCVNKIDQEL